MIYVEIELDGVLCSKRCPKALDERGLTDYQAVRAYFEDLGYAVGSITVR
ncbi:hypothetical protein RIM32_004897 [Pseudomonas aeruginosa]|nr:hypothetical protein [Pseudomonas aeruginosa]